MQQEVITFEFIRDVQRREKSKKGIELEELPENFFVLVKNWISEKEKLFEKTKDPELLLEINNAKKIVKEIISLRQKKLVIAALHVIRGSPPPENMLPQEKMFFEQLVDLLKNYENYIEIEEEEEREEEEVSAEEEKKEEEEEKPKEGFVRVKALTNIPKFVDDNLNTYGPYKEGDVFELPENIARILISRKVVEEV